MLHIFLIYFVSLSFFSFNQSILMDEYQYINLVQSLLDDENKPLRENRTKSKTLSRIGATMRYL